MAGHQTLGAAGTVGPLADDLNGPAIRPLTARSVVLSTLLGYYPPELTVSALVRVGGLFGIAERSIRVALSRMVADGDLVAVKATYRLSPRLIRRQRRQDDSAAPPTKPWNGDWAMVIVTSPARPLPDRVALRRSMVELRYSELREGVWLRPDNLEQPTDTLIADQCTTFTSQCPDSAELAARLWDLPTWETTARSLTAALTAPVDLHDGFLLIAEVINHLQRDPLLPPTLVATDWPGPGLRNRFVAFRDDYAAQLRDYCTR
jgi:phenylacetic acid degradation operon negative regulatory protein